MPTSQSETAGGSESGAAGPPPVGRVLVGVDGSAESVAALRWALREAKAHNVGLHAVFAYTHHSEWADTGIGDMIPVTHRVGAEPVQQSGGGTLGAEEAANNSVELGVANGLRGLIADGDGWTGRVTQEAIQGQPAQVLLDRATESDIIVVGSHGRGKLKGALLGSVSQSVVAGAPCPVLVIPKSAD